MAGGGVVSAGAESLLAQVAERLGAPVFTTFMGKAALSSEDPLKVGLPWSRATSDLTDMRPYLSPLFAEANGLVAIGCRFTQATTASWALKLPPLVQIDIDAAEIGRHYPVLFGVHADAGQTLKALLPHLPTRPRPPWARPAPATQPWRLPGLDLVAPLRKALPRDAIVVADITRLSYILLAEFPVYEPRTFLHPAGFVAMGYGIPAALGAKAALPQRAVVTVVGDGCFLMCGMELATAVQEKLPIVVVLLNDGSLTLIKAIQQRRYEGRFVGVDLRNPDFALFARAFGVRAWQVDSDAAFARALDEALASGEPALIDVRLPRA
jgi:acetolactate synthase-1/2/3 large subunit